MGFDVKKAGMSGSRGAMRGRRRGDDDGHIAASHHKAHREVREQRAHHMRA